MSEPRASKVDTKNIAYALHQFEESLDLLRDYIGFLSPVLKRRQTADIKKDAIDLMPLLLAFDRLDLDFELDDDQRKRLDQRVEGRLEITEAEHGVKLNFTDRDIEGKFASAVQNLSRALERTNHLNKSSVVSLVSAAETFMAQIVSAYLEKHPGIISKDSEYRFTLRDMSEFDTIDDARKFLIARKVENLIRGRFDECLRFIFGTLKVNSELFDEYQAYVIEVIQRRNIIVHNMSVVNAIYVSNVDDAIVKEFKAEVEKPLGCAREYLEDAIKCVESFFLLLAFRVFVKLEKDEEVIFDLFNEIAFKHLEAGRYEQGKLLYGLLCDLKGIKEQNKYIAVINRWQCFKWLGDFGVVEKEVESFDDSALSRQFRLARFALLDEEKEFFALMPDVIEKKDIRVERL